MKTTKTGIIGFDELIGEGIPFGSNVLIYGKPGSGKTIMGLEYIYNGASKFNEPGVHVSIEDTPDKLILQCKRFKWKIDPEIKANKIKFLCYTLNEITRDFANEICNTVNAIKAKRLVVDNLAFLAMSPVFNERDKFCMLDKDKILVAKNEQQFVYNLISILDKTNTTKLYLTTEQDNSSITTDGVSEYVCDGLIHLRNTAMGKSYLRTTEVVKLRRAQIHCGIYGFKITDTGIVVEK